MFSWIFSKPKDNKEKRESRTGLHQGAVASSTTNTANSTNCTVTAINVAAKENDWELLGRPATQMLNEIEDDFDDCKIGDGIEAENENDNENNNSSSQSTSSSSSDESDENEENDENNENNENIECGENNDVVRKSSKRRRRKRSGKSNGEPLRELSYAQVAKKANLGGTSKMLNEEHGSKSDEEKSMGLTPNTLKCVVVQDQFDRNNANCGVSRKSGAFRNKKALKQQKLKEKFLSKRAHREIKKEIKRRQQPQYGLYN